MLAKSHDVWVLAQDWPGEVREDIESVPLVGATLVRSRRTTALLRSGAALVRRRSLQLGYAADSAMARAFRRTLRDFQPHVVHFNVARSTWLLEEHTNARTVVDLDDIRSDYYRTIAEDQAEPVWWRALAKLESSRLRSVEEAVALRADAVLVSSPADVMRVGDKARLVRSPHEIPPGAARSREEPPTVLFVGRMSYRPNVAAIVNFARDVLPGVRRQHPNAHLEIVGERPAPQVRALDRVAGVRVRGSVVSTAPFYRRASVAVVPVTQVTGVQMKLIQALAAGVPTVCTRQVGYQAGVTDNEVVFADSPEEWVMAVSHLISDRERADNLAQAGRRWADQHYSEKAIRGALSSVYGEFDSPGV